MDRNSLIGILLIGLILIIFSVLNQPSQDEIERARRERDSLEQVRREMEEAQPDPAERETPGEPEILEEDPETTAEGELERLYGPFAEAGEGDNEYYTIENELLVLTVSRKGGRPYSVELKNYKTFDSLPLILFNGDENSFGLNFFASNRSITTNNLYFELVSEEERVVADTGPESLAMRINAGNGRYIEYVYTMVPDSYMLDFEINLVRMNEIMGSAANFIDLYWEVNMPGHEKNPQHENNYTSLYFRHYGDDLDKLSERRSMDEEEIRTRLKWVGFKHQFFSSLLVADDHFLSGYVRQEKLDEETYLRNFVADLRLPYDGNPEEKLGFSFYFGTNHYNTLKTYSSVYENENGYDLALEKMVPLGWGIFGWINRYIIIPVFNFLENYTSNYGIIILLLTISIKIVFFPLTYKSHLSTSKMRVLKPQVDEINERIPKEKSMERQQAMMDLYKRAGVNPMGGCLPMLIQLPILIAMFRFFPTSFELRQESFLWAEDLSTYDSILNLPFTIPWYGDHVSLFTLLMCISTIIYTRMNSKMTAGSSQMPGMKSMMYMMPVMLLFIFNSYASALSYYYFLTNMITFGQIAIIKRFVDDEAILRKLNENKKKPRKKSKFQARMEQMAKQKSQQAASMKKKPKTGGRQAGGGRKK